ncbi:uncharacterized protein LOC108208334 [Daucus carota subsp. sativus]|uniref:uncharacterized protein LOC108208334 n=1 Tax=Daucus carota subsp. sativus TaxID=79200 RepID=UPI0007EFE754|nr:PREDICTED: uncharacterized protein LOC108208334 [Daucus carota subsp. sativus]
MAHHSKTPACSPKQSKKSTLNALPSYIQYIYTAGLQAKSNSYRKLAVLHKPQPAEDLSQSSFSMHSYVVYVILFLSLDACNGRILGLYTDKGDFFGTDVHNSNLHSTLATSKLQHFGTEELQSLENHNAETGQSKISQSPPCAVSVKGIPSEETLNQKITKEWRRQALSTSGSVAQDVEEPADSNSKDIIEDVVVMDYAQPHRKPPIHNTKD